MRTTDNGSISNQRAKVSTWGYFLNHIITNRTWLINVIFWRLWEIRGRLRTVKREGNGKRSTASLKNEPGVSPVFLQNNHTCPVYGKTHHDYKKYIDENWKINAVIREIFRSLVEDVKLLEGE